MHIIFGQATYWTVPLLKVLKFFKFKVFYLSIVEKSVSKKNEIAKKLKKKNIYPLPIELEKKGYSFKWTKVTHNEEVFQYYIISSLNKKCD